ncbi:uncharacterized protein LOC100215940 isoform X3 [Hydra vulgaris]|uniref:Uncharacterized protein LOC100215940 isoform X2 n=1 Tax=Hydra vulgaris TaxID=6087 RepID=A0ABM4BS84_HYDVU
MYRGERAVVNDMRIFRKIIDERFASLIRMDIEFRQILEDLVIDLHENPKGMIDHLVEHRYFNELVYGILRIMDHHTPMAPRIAGNAAYVIGALIDSPVGKEKVVALLQNEDRVEDTQHCLPNLAAIIETGDPEPMTNASGTASLIFESEQCLNWALEQPSCEWFISVLGQALVKGDMWVASNCALTLARISMNKNGLEKIARHPDFDELAMQLIASVGVDDEGRGMNAAFALGYLCENEDLIAKIVDYKEFWDLMHGLIQMLRSLDDGCKKNSAFCLKAISQWKIGQQQINDDPDITYLLEILTKLLTAGDEDLAKMAANILCNLAQIKKGYMLQKDDEKIAVKPTLKHVLSQMSISENYREEAFKAMKALMLDKPDPPVLKVLDAHSIHATWEVISSKCNANVQYELQSDGANIVYLGPDTSYTVTGLKEKTFYEFTLRAITDENEESFTSDPVTVQTFRSVSTPPQNLRAIQVTASQVKIVWEKPLKIIGNLKGYRVKETGSSIHYEPVSLYYIASNLEADKEYTFEVCAVTQRGDGEVASVSVRTLGHDYHAPSKPRLVCIGPNEIVCTWEPPAAKNLRIKNYEVICNGKAIYFGTVRKCIANRLKENTIHTFSVIAWTSEGRRESLPATKKTTGGYKKKALKKRPWKNESELQKWLKDEETEELKSDSEESDNGSAPTDANDNENEDSENPQKTDSENEEDSS